MTKSQALFHHLNSSTALTALVENRIYPVRAEQENDDLPLAPMIVYALVDQQPEGGVSITVAMTTEWSFICAAADYDAAHAVAEALIAALHRYRGVMGGDGGVFVMASRLLSAKDLDEAGEFGLFAVGVTVQLQIRSE